MAEAVPASQQLCTQDQSTSNQPDASQSVHSAQHTPEQQLASEPSESPCPPQGMQQAVPMAAPVAQPGAALAAQQAAAQAAPQAPATGQAGSAPLPPPVLQALEIMVQGGADKQKALVALSSVPTTGMDIEG